jgi:hypothetical protein
MKAKQAVCQSNLNTIGKALAMYSGVSSGSTPFPLLDCTKGADPNVKPTDKNATDDVWDGEVGTGGMQNFWLVASGNKTTGAQDLVAPSAFHCPSDGRWAARTSATAAGWTSPYQYSYGVHFPYDKDADGKDNPARLSDDGMDGGVAILSDLNPGGPVTSTGTIRRPSNHPAAGEAILYRAGNVGFYASTKDSKGGMAGDDIYVNEKGVVGGLPASATDTSIIQSGRDAKPASATTKPAVKATN